MIPRSSAPGVLDRPGVEENDSSGSPSSGWIVTVFDNPFNTIDEVVHILMVATGCTLGEAEMETWEVHHLGRSVVHHSDQQECQQVAAVIAQIGIDVKVSQQ